MSWYFAAATFAAGTIGAVGKRKSARAMARERRRAAHESLLTAKYNIRERNKESRQTQFQVLETGGNLTRQIAIEGKRAEGAAAVAGATSGATIDSGTPRAALSNIVQEAISAQTDAVISTKNRIKSIARQTKNANTSEWRNAKLNQRQQNRIAGEERQAADRAFTADMIKTGISSYAAGATVGGANPAKWGGASKATTTATGASGAWSPGAGRTKSGVLKSSGGALGSGPKPWEVGGRGRGVSKMKGYSMDKVQPIGGSESSNTWERLAAQMKRGVDFSPEGFGRIMDFTKGRKNTPFWNFILGRGLKGKAASTTFPRK